MTKAWVSHTPGGPETLVFEDVPLPDLRADDVLVRVQAVGINFTDGLLIRDHYQVRPPRPLVPGGEFCGVVEATGPAGARFRPGDVVVGVCGWGALAEHVVVPADGLVAIPDDLPRTEAAAFLFAYATAFHALRDAGDLRSGETLVVLGAGGGVGSAAVELGAALGARVIAAASTLAKLDFAMARGATAGVRYSADLQPGAGQKAFAGELKALVPHGVDVVLDPVGGPYTEPALRSLAGGGRHLVVGFTAGIPHVPLNLALLKHCHIIGVDWRTFIRAEPAANERNIEALLGLWRSGAIRPVVTELPFAAAPAAITRLESRAAIGKVVVNLQA